LVNVVPSTQSTLRFMPPLIIGEAEVDAAIGILDHAIVSQRS